VCLSHKTTHSSAVIVVNVSTATLCYHAQRSARIESERAKQAFEIQQEAELTLSQKFKGIVSDLRRSWEEEETG
jgi:hypothetical protein